MSTESDIMLMRHAADLLAELESVRELIRISRQGQPGGNPVRVDNHELLLHRLAALEALASGEFAVAGSRVMSHADARLRMSRWLK